MKSPLTDLKPLPKKTQNSYNGRTMELEKETALVETVLFLESEPVTEKTISNIAELSEDVVKLCVENLKEKYGGDGSGIELAMITGGWVLVPKGEFWDVLRERYGEKNSGRLSKSALETLTIVAYKQPITRSEIEQIRGVSADNMIRLLAERQLIKEVGRKDVPGRPIQFGTTKEFLKFFRLNSISELPRLDEDEEQRFELAR